MSLARWSLLWLASSCTGPDDSRRTVDDSSGDATDSGDSADSGAGCPSGSVGWDGRNDAGAEVAPGVYRAWLIDGDRRTSIKLARQP